MEKRAINVGEQKSIGSKEEMWLPRDSLLDKQQVVVAVRPTGCLLVDLQQTGAPSNSRQFSEALTKSIHLAAVTCMI